MFLTAVSAVAGEWYVVLLYRALHAHGLGPQVLRDFAALVFSATLVGHGLRTALAQRRGGWLAAVLHVQQDGVWVIPGRGDRRHLRWDDVVAVSLPRRSVLSRDGTGLFLGFGPHASLRSTDLKHVLSVALGERAWTRAAEQSRRRLVYALLVCAVLQAAGYALVALPVKENLRGEEWQAFGTIVVALVVTGPCFLLPFLGRCGPSTPVEGKPARRDRSN